MIKLISLFFFNVFSTLFRDCSTRMLDQDELFFHWGAVACHFELVSW